MRDNLRLRLMVWITGLQAGDHAHGELAPARYREAVTRCAMTLPNMAMKLPGETWIARSCLLRLQLISGVRPKYIDDRR